MSIQGITATYRGLLPLLLLAINTADKDDARLPEVRAMLFRMAKDADKWREHLDELHAISGGEA